MKNKHDSVRKSLLTKYLAASLGLAVASIMIPQGASAATLTWDSDATFNGTFGGAGTWDTSALNWSGAGPSDEAWATNTTTGDTAVFGGTAGTVTLGTSISALGLTFNTTGYTLSSGALSLGTGGIDASTLTSGNTTISSPVTLADAQSWTVGSGATLVASGIIDGSGALTKAGAGTLTLSGSNTFTAGLTLSAGTINFSNNASFGTGTITSSGGTIKSTAGVATTNNLVVNGATTLDVTGGNWNLNGNISGSGAITRGSGANLSLYLGGDNSGYTGTFTNPNVANAVLRFNSPNSGSAGANWVFANTNSGKTTLSWSGTGAISFGSMTGAGQLTTDSSGAKTISVGAMGLNDTFSGTISNGTGTIGLTKVGGGTLTLTGANTYSGSTTVNSGTLKLGNNLAIQNSALDTSGAGTVDVTGFTTPTLGGLIGGTDLSSVITAGYGSVTALTLNPQTGVSGTYSGIIADGAAGMTLTKSGAGTQTLTGTNTYTGATTISAGQLVIGGAGQLGAGSYAGNISLAGNGLAYNSSANQTFSGTITGAGGLTKGGASTLTLTGASNAITGAVTMNSGVLDLGSDLGLGGGTLVNGSGGTINATGGGRILLNVASGDLGVANGGTLTVNAVIANGSQNSIDFWNTSNGTGLVVLTADNTFDGTTTIQSGTVSVSKIGDSGVAGNLGKNGTINFGNGTSAGALRYTGAGETNNRAINLFSNGTIQNDGGALGLSGGISTNTTGNKQLTLRGAGSTTISGAITSGSGALGLLKLDTGTLNLSGGGTLNAAFGGYGTANSGFIIRGGTTNITSGAYSTTTEAIIGGVTTAGETGVNTNLTLNGGSLTITNYLSLGRGNGTGSVSSDIVLNNNAAITANNFSAGYNNNSTLNLPKGTFTLNGTSSFTIASGGAFNLGESIGSNMTMTLNDSATVTVNGNGSTTNRNIGNLGTGTLTLNGAGATFTDASTSILNVGYQNGTGVLNVNAGTFNHTNGEIIVGASQANGSFTGNGTINVAGGTLNTKALTVGRNANSVATSLSGTVNVTSGTLNVLNSTSLIGWQGIGANGVVNISGGSFNQGTTATTTMSIGSISGANGSVNVSSGALTFQNNSGLRFADTTGANASTRSLTISGGNVTFYSDAGSTVGGTGAIDMMLTANASGTNTINLNGGTLTANQIKVSSATGTRVINFNGGTLKSGASALSGTFLAAGVATTANVRDGGAIIDTNGNSVAIGQVLAHSNIGGDAATDGGLTKTGLGTLTLNGANTYTGATTVNNGTLAVGASGAISSTVVLGKIGVSTGTLDVAAQASYTLADLSGNGTVNIGTGKTVTATGAVAPGFGVGSLNVTGGFTLQGTTTMQIAGSNGVGGTDFDLVSTSEAVTFGGSLSIASLGGYDLGTANQSYKLFNAGSFAGNFTSVSVGGTSLTYDAPSDSWSAGGYTFNEGTGTLLVVPEPSTFAMLLGGVGMLGIFRRNRRK